MNDSILNSIKKLLGIEEDYNAFDDDLIIHINSVMVVLTQLGIGPKDFFMITGPEETWSQFFGDSNKIALVKTYVYLKVRLLFDPPDSGVLHEAVERQIQEFEWRLNVEAETPSSSLPEEVT